MFWQNKIVSLSYKFSAIVKQLHCPYQQFWATSIHANVHIILAINHQPTTWRNIKQNRFRKITSCEVKIQVRARQKWDCNSLTLLHEIFVWWWLCNKDEILQSYFHLALIQILSSQDVIFWNLFGFTMLAIAHKFWKHIKFLN